MEGIISMKVATCWLCASPLTVLVRPHPSSSRAATLAAAAACMLSSQCASAAPTPRRGPLAVEYKLFDILYFIGLLALLAVCC